MGDLDNIGIGIDMINVARFSDKKKTSPLIKRVFTDNEIKYCFAKKNPAPHVAVRFAGKEAVVKAVAPLQNGILDYKHIEILRNKKNIPFVTITNKKFNSYKIKISLSHTTKDAIAFAIAYQKNDKQRNKSKS